MVVSPNNPDTGPRIALLFHMRERNSSMLGGAAENSAYILDEGFGRNFKLKTVSRAFT